MFHEILENAKAQEGDFLKYIPVLPARLVPQGITCFLRTYNEGITLKKECADESGRKLEGFDAGGS